MDTSRDTDRTCRRPVAATLLLGVAFALAACSSSGGTATQPAAATQGPAATTGAAQATPAATEAGQVTTQPAGGGSAGNVCDLVTPAEMGSALKLDGLTSHAVLGPPDTCGYDDPNLGGVAAMVLTVQGGDAAFGAIAAMDGSQQIAGIGDKAVYNDTAQTLLVMKGGKLLTITVSRADADLPGPRVDLLKQIAAIAAGRM